MISAHHLRYPTTRLLPALALLLVASNAGAVLTYAYERSSVRIDPRWTPRPGPQQPSGIKVARNEFEALQVVLRESGVNPSVDICATAPAFFKNGATPLAGAVKLYRVAPINIPNVAKLSNNEGQSPGNYYEILIPDVEQAVVLDNSFGPWQVRQVTQQRRAFSIGPGNWIDMPGGNVPFVIWVEVFAAPAAVPGTYQGTLGINIGCDSGVNELDVPLTVEVLPFTIPATSSLRTFIDFNADIASSYHMNNQVFHYATEDENRLISEVYARFFLEHRLSINLAHAPDGELDKEFSNEFMASY